jgi:amino acid transporter
VFGNAQALKICMALSAFGNIVAVTYTATKGKPCFRLFLDLMSDACVVKQSIAVQRILPFWRYLEKDKRTPKGAIVLHWISNIIFIAAAPVSSDGYSFTIGLYVYGNIMCSTIVAVGLPLLEKRMRDNPNNSDFRLSFFKSRWVLYSLPYLFAAGNILILVFSGKTHNQGKTPRWWWLVTLVAIIAVSWFYWGTIQLLKKTRVPAEDGSPRTWGDILGVRLRIYENAAAPGVPPEVARDINDAWLSRIDGSKRRVHVTFHGPLARLGQTFERGKDVIAQYVF